MGRRSFRFGNLDELERRLVLSAVAHLPVVHDAPAPAAEIKSIPSMAETQKQQPHKSTVPKPKAPPNTKPVAVASPAQAPTLLELANDPLLVRELYGPAGQGGGSTSDVASDGATSVNAEWESGQSATWYIEEQRYGADLIAKGVVRRDDNLINKGLEELNWGFARQGPGGNFPGTSDAFHSTSFFVEAAARAMLLLQQSGDPAYQQVIRQDTPKIEAAARWLMEPYVGAMGRAGDAPYTHRRWILAAALGETAALTGDRAMASAAEAYARMGLSQQTRQGVNPEKGGYDVSYQALGLLMAARYDAACTDPSLRASIGKMIVKGLDWESTKVDAQGNVSAVGSTRTGKEYGPAGNLKMVTYPIIVEAFTAGAAITGNGGFEATAGRIAASQDLNPTYES